MKIAIASGKGGTGKTTIAVNLAATAGRSGANVQYLDCDVEEPNGEIFLKPQIKEHRRVCVPVPQVDQSKCTGCGTCGKICRFGAITAVKGKVLCFENLCHSCGGCALACPAGAITEKQLPVGSIETGNAGPVNFTAGTLQPGDIRTVAVVRHVKEYALADKSTKATTIIDAAPGTTCPVVQALKGVDHVVLVTEPTPFGFNDLKLAVDMTSRLGLDISVAINRCNTGDSKVKDYCKEKAIKIDIEIPEDRKIAEASSRGELIIDAVDGCSGLFEEFAKTLGVIQ